MPKDWTGNLHSIAGMIGATGHSAEERELHDYYATSPIAAEWLLKLEDLPMMIWENACGEGFLSKVFEASGRYVRSTDLIDRGFGQGGWTSSNRQKNGMVRLSQTHPTDTHKSLSSIRLNL